MKRLDTEQIEQLAGIRLGAADTFRFRCHAAIACFNRCCRNLNLFLYPYDLVRLKNRLGLTSDAFIDRYTDFVLREGAVFPDVLLRMADNADRTCPFLTAAGCAVYPDRPDACRTFPLEQGMLFDAAAGRHVPVHLFRPPDFCLGRHEDRQWTLRSWAEDQEAVVYNRMTARWAEIMRLFQDSAFGPADLQGDKAKMAVMATYNLDRFRDFIFHSSYLKRFQIDAQALKKVRKNDMALMLLGFEWIKLFLFQIPSRMIRPL